MSDDNKRTILGYPAPARPDASAQTTTPAPAHAPSAGAPAHPPGPPYAGHAPHVAPHAHTPPPAYGQDPHAAAHGHAPHAGYAPPPAYGQDPHAAAHGHTPHAGYVPPPAYGHAPSPGPQGYAPPQPGYAPAPGAYAPQPGAGGWAGAASALSIAPVKTGLYVFMFWFGLLAGGGLTAWGASDRKVQELLMVSWAPLLVSAIFFWVLLYKAWAAIQDGQARTTPGKALGFLFIPFFNIYWAFVAIGGWGEAFNRFADRHALRDFRAAQGLFVFHCVAMIIPFGAIAVPITGTMITLQLCRGINAVANRHGMPEARLVERR